MRSASNETEQISAIEAFFQDNNNMAMYVVLPLIVLVYGGCSAIYCVAKCRRYLRKRNRQKKHKKDGIVHVPNKGDGSRGHPDGTDRLSADGEKNFAANPIGKGRTSRSGSEMSDNRSVPGVIGEYDDKSPLVSSTARKHTPPPVVENDRMSAVDNGPNRQSRNAKTPASMEMDERSSRNSDADSLAARAALFTVSNTRGRDSSNRDAVQTPSTSRQGVAWHQTGSPPRYNDDPKAGFKAMLNSNYNPLYSHNADPWESMRAMEMKSMGQSNNAPWAKQVKYDEFGRPKPQKKQRLIFVA